MFTRILYTSLEDVSVPYGPGVNERTFLKDTLRRFGNRLHAVIPRPVGGMPEELDALQATLIPSWRSVRNPMGWIQSRMVGGPILLRALKTFQPDLVVMRVGAFALPQFLAARRSPVPYVLKTGIGSSFSVFFERYPLARPFEWLNRYMAEGLLTGASSIDVVRSHQRDLVVARHPSLAPRIHVVDNGVDLDHFQLMTERQPVRRRLKLPLEGVVIGYVGAYPMQRGGKEVIDTVKILGATGNIAGLVVGDNGEAAACREYAQSLGVSDQVVVYGAADYGDVPDLMGAMDIALSIRRPDERGDSEMKVRQYLASGLCVVGTAGSNDFLVGKPFARVVRSVEPEQVASAVASLIDYGRERRSALAHEARAFAEASLSFEARNTERIQLWESAFRTRVFAKRHSS